MKLSEELAWRGFIQQTTLGDLSKLDEKQWVFYHGFDASAPSQTVGNLAAMMADRVFMRHGHKAVILAGGATSLIGDPGGKDSERTLQSEDVIAANIEAAKSQMTRIYKGYDFTLVNNLDWMRNTTVIGFLRDIGKHFSMTPLVQRDYIAKRMREGGSGISYTEFSYTLLQGMDYLHLYDNFGVSLQLGGSDQWGNCLSGVELVRKARGAEAHVLTLPLVINKATGKKFGKSEDGAIWLDPDLTSPTQFYQFWINVDDAGVEGYLKIFTELDKAGVDELMNEHTANPKLRLAQRRLAEEVTNLVHGTQEMQIARQITAYLTGEHSIGDADEEILVHMRTELAATRAGAGTPIVDVLAATGLVASKSEARRLLAGGALYINGQKITKQSLETSDFLQGKLLLRKGRAFKDTAIVEE